MSNSSSNTPFLQLLLVVFCLSCTVQLSYWIFFLWHFIDKKKNKYQSPQQIEGVSLIICIKNELENIGRHVNSWIEQLGEKDELIFVDDFSTDNTLALLQDISSYRENVTVISCTKDRPGKKQALSDGINIAKNDIILVTDADCKVSQDWKTRMLNNMSEKTDFILAYAPFYKADGYLNVFQRFENALTALQYFSFASAGIPYMGVGRNLMFRKRIFDPNIYTNDIASGDDDILVSSKANKKNTKTCLDPKTFVYSEAPASLGSYLKQKSRHMTSSVEYKPVVKVLLALFSGSQILSNVLFVILLFSSHYLLALLFFLAKILVIAITLHNSGKMLDQRKLYRFTIILDLCLSLYYLVLTILFPLRKRRKWS